MKGLSYLVIKLLRSIIADPFLDLGSQFKQSLISHIKLKSPLLEVRILLHEAKSLL